MSYQPTSSTTPILSHLPLQTLKHTPASTIISPQSSRHSPTHSSPPSTSSTSAGSQDDSLQSSGARILLRRCKYNSLEPLRAIYRSAARSFLHKEHLSVWMSICEGLEKIDVLLPDNTHTAEDDDDHQPWWTNSEILKASSPSLPDSPPGWSKHPPSPIEMRLDQELHELARKFQILRITFVASVYSTTTVEHIKSLILHQSPPLYRTKTDPLLELLALQPDIVISTLWSLAASHHQDLESCMRDPLPNTLDSISLMNIHPSIVTATALASIKLSAPQSGKWVCEAWLSSLNVGVLDYLQTLMGAEHPPISSTTTHNQFVILNNSAECPAKRGGSNIRYNYARLIEVYAVHILGSVHEWQFASEFVHAQSSEAGGVLPNHIVQVCLCLPVWTQTRVVLFSENFLCFSPDGTLIILLFSASQNVLRTLHTHRAQQLQTAELFRSKHERLQKEWDERQAAQRSPTRTTGNRALRPVNYTRRRVLSDSEQRTSLKPRIATNTSGGKSKGHSNSDPVSLSPPAIGNRRSRSVSRDPAAHLTDRRASIDKPRQEPQTALDHYLDRPPPLSGFASLRDHLTRFLSQTPHPSQPQQPITRSLKSVLRSLLASADLKTVGGVSLVRLVTMIGCLLAMTKMIRSRPLNLFWFLQRIIMILFQKLAQTIKMGTRLTYIWDDISGVWVWFCS